MHVSSQDRLDMIAMHMRDFDIVTLIGTKYKHQPYLQEPLSKRSAGNSVMLDAGYGSGRYTNNHTGIGFLINNRTLKESNLVEKGAISGDARGRAAYVRFKVRGGDFAFLGAYFPPKPSTKKDHPKYFKTCELVASYLSEVICNLPSGCTPFISVDLNDGIGRVKMERNMSTKKRQSFKGMPADWKNIVMVQEPCSGEYVRMQDWSYTLQTMTTEIHGSLEMEEHPLSLTILRVRPYSIFAKRVNWHNWAQFYNQWT